ncbi:MAG TPA: glycosyltransferase [Methylotenera sp.]|nr:glycosyltransferase [Methylotenera sp.]
MHKNILFISKGETASSTRYRALQYFPFLKKNDWIASHSTISGGLRAITASLIAAHQADVVVLLRKTFPMPIFWLLRKLSKKLIFDFDDAIFCNTDGSNSDTRMQRFKHTIKHCDYIFAGNGYLAAHAKQFNTTVEIIPTSIDTGKYNLDCQKDTQALTLVWIGSSSTKKYLIDILPQLENAAHSVPSLQLNNISDFQLSSPTLKINNIPWHAETEAIELNKADIGIAPMLDNNWTKGKCALKVLQYMASGLPVISSHSGVNAEVIQDQATGYLVKENEDWPELIMVLQHKKSQLQQMGQQGKLFVNNEFSMPAVYQKILAVLNRLS